MQTNKQAGRQASKQPTILKAIIFLTMAKPTIEFQLGGPAVDIICPETHALPNDLQGPTESRWNGPAHQTSAIKIPQRPKRPGLR